MCQSNKTAQLAISKLLSICLLILLVSYTNAQRPRNGGGGGGAKRAAPAKDRSRPVQPAVSKPSAPTRNANVSTAGTRNVNSGNRNINTGDRTVNGGNRNNINAGNNNNIGNKVNVNNSNKNVNINIDNSRNVQVNNSRNTVVRRNVRPYPRPPYVYGGFRYHCYHPYFFHPYRPFVWGPVWHPWGFFIATLATTAIILSVDNNMPGDIDLAYTPGYDNSIDQASSSYALQASLLTSGPMMSPFMENEVQAAHPALKDEYYYDQGVYYLKADGGYTVVSAPIGAVIKTLPTGYETVTIDDKTKNYYWGGTFYEKTSAGYKVVPPTSGAVVEHVSKGGEEVKLGDITYVKMGETYYQPIQQDGKDMYEVADVEADK